MLSAKTFEKAGDFNADPDRTPSPLIKIRKGTELWKMMISTRDTLVKVRPNTNTVNLTNPHPRIAIWGAILRVGNSE